MTDTIDWSQNCLTGGIHNGRDGEIWNIPLGYAVIIFDEPTLRELVVERIHSDAMQLVQNSSEYSEPWADSVKQRADESFTTKLQHKVGELSNTYKAAMWRADQQQAVELFKKGKLNPNYACLHSHDTINMLCRIIGVSATQYVARGV